MPKPGSIVLSGQMTQWSNDGGVTWNNGGLVLQNPDGSLKFTGYPTQGGIQVRTAAAPSPQALVTSSVSTLILSGITLLPHTQLISQSQTVTASSVQVVTQTTTEDEGSQTVTITTNTDGSQTITGSQSSSETQTTTTSNNSSSSTSTTSTSSSQSSSITQSGGNIQIG